MSISNSPTRSWGHSCGNALCTRAHLSCKHILIALRNGNAWEAATSVFASDHAIIAKLRGDIDLVSSPYVHMHLRMHWTQTGRPLSYSLADGWNCVSWMSRSANTVALGTFSGHDLGQMAYLCREFEGVETTPMKSIGWCSLFLLAEAELCITWEQDPNVWR